VVRIRDLSNIRIEPISVTSAGGVVRGLLYHTNRAATCIVLCHGYSSSKSNVDPLAYHLAVEGYIALAFDFQGHKLGASSLPLAKAADLVINALDVVAYAKAMPDVRRIVIGGHSMGAATAIGVALRSQLVSGVIVLSTAMKRAHSLTGEGLLSGLANRAVYVDGAGSSEIAALMDTFTGKIADVAPKPLLVVAASNDALVAPSATRLLFDAASEPKTFETIEGNHTDCAERSRFVVVRWLKANGFAI
jgi:alpha-beta hydrolase superfamily lysophospholipase